MSDDSSDDSSNNTEIVGVQPLSVREIAKTAISDRFAEELFGLWMAEKSFSELVDMYRDTPREFSIASVSRAAERYGWVERRGRIMDLIRHKNDEALAYFKNEKLKMLQQIMSLARDNLNRQYTKYMENPDPKNRPDLLPTSIVEFDKFCRLYGFEADGGVEKSEVSIHGNVDVDASNLPDEVAEKVLQMMSEATTKRLMESAKNNRAISIPVESYEVKDDDKEDK